MSRRADERGLEDYLDGRLGEQQRSAFEKRLREEPELAAAVRTARRLGDALRDGSDVLPPGFYARARRRFEESAGAGRGFRLFSWEAAGLAAAAVLAFALFVPQFLHEGVGDVEPTLPAPADAADAADAAEREGADLRFADDAAGLDSPAKQERAKEAARPEPIAEPGEYRPAEKKMSDAEAEAPRREDSLAEERFAPVPPAVAEAAGEPLARAEADSDLRQQNAAAPPPIARGRAMKNAAEPSQESGRRVAAPQSAVSPKRDAPAAAAAAAAAVALPAGVVEPATLRSIEERDGWDALLRGAAGDALATLGPPDPARRLVLVGGRAGLTGCADLDVVSAGEAWEIRYRPSVGVGGKTAASGGCALTLPRDGRPLRLVPAP